MPALIRVCVALQNPKIEGVMGNVGEIITVRPSEYMVFVPPGTKKIKINHPDYLPFTYTFQQKIESNQVYELYISVPEAGPQTHQYESGFVTLRVTPDNATVLIDDMPHTLAEGALSEELALGRHTYRIIAPQYHSYAGEFEITATETCNLDIALKPAYGWLDVTTTPAGVQVMIDGEVRDTSPCRIKLNSGDYYVQFMSEGYIAYGENITITDGATKSLNTALKANFAQVTLNAPFANSEIWLRGEKIGTGSWSGRLNTGTYAVEIRTDGYEVAKQNIEVEAEVPLSVTLETPIPIYGMLKINSTPFDAVVKLDGKEVGRTPWQNNKVLACSHTLEVVSEGYDSYSETFTLGRNEIKSLGLTLKKSSVKPVATPTQPTSSSSSSNVTNSTASSAADTASGSASAEKSYKVGDYYNENGKEGVVFWVDATGKHGKIVNMNEDYVNLKWFNENSSFAVALGTDRYDGAENMEIVKKNAKWSKYAAFRWCEERVGKGWYLPAIGELEILNQNRAVLDSRLKEKGGEPLTDRIYVSSTDVNKYAYYGFNMGRSQTCQRDKCIVNPNVIRSVTTF